MTIISYYICMHNLENQSHLVAQNGITSVDHQPDRVLPGENSDKVNRNSSDWLVTIWVA